MARINLLPWRTERRKQRQKEFLSLLGVTALVALLIAFGAVQYADALIAHQNKRNEYLTAEINALDAKLVEIAELEKKRAHLLQRKQVIEQLQADRSQMVHLFDQLVRTIPEGVKLGSIKQAGPLLTLEGRAQSQARVSSYMRALEDSGWMTNADLSIIQAEDSDRSLPHKFTLQVTLTKPKPPVDPNAPPAVEGTAAQPAAQPATGGGA
jgi:type IV pilus assembly protein PilN